MLNSKTRNWLMGALIGLSSVVAPAMTRAADQGDNTNDQGADVADLYAFLDPNDNSRVVLIATMHGFIVAGEAVNFGVLDPDIQYHFDIERTGDLKPDATIDVRFAERTVSAGPQAGTVTIRGLGGNKKTGLSFNAPSTPSSLNDTSATRSITTDPTTGIVFFAGIVDDPFFFDVAAYERFVASVNAGAPDASVLNRSRDTFAGYSIMAVAMSIPVSFVKGSSDTLGFAFSTQRRTQSASTTGLLKTSGKFRTVDRLGTPIVSLLPIPQGRKLSYNALTPQQLAAGAFLPDIASAVAPFGTDSTSIGTITSIAVTTGDFLRLDTRIANTGSGGGTNPEAAFPNGRRLRDDAVDYVLTLLNNRQPLSDNVNANERAILDTFPFVALPHQPLPNGAIDDETRN